MIDIETLRRLSLSQSVMHLDSNIFSMPSNMKPHLIDDKCFFPYCQGKTGYCWLESTLQCISLYARRKYGIDYFFDDAYLMFFDKLEKANLFLENILQCISEEIGGRCNSYILRNAMTDKGQWQMSRNLIEKYGLVMKNGKSDGNTAGTSELNMYISYLLRIGAFKIRKSYAEQNYYGVEEIKENALQNIYNVLVAFYGEQVEKYISQIYDGLTPKEFYDEKIAFPFDDYISIYPTLNNQMVEVEMSYDGNVAELPRNKFLGVSNEMFEELFDEQLEQDGFCWCSGDFGKFYMKNAKILDDRCINSDSGVFDNIKLDGFNRVDIFSYHLANMSHAFVVCRDNTKENKIDYYAYDSAYDINKGEACQLSRSWIDKYLLQTVVSKKNIKDSGRIKNVKEYPWDFFGL